MASKNNQVNNLSKLIKALREEKDESLYDIEKATNISASYIQRLETGDRGNISLEYLTRILRHYNLPISIIVDLYPDSFTKGVSEKADTLDELIIKDKFIFAGVESNLDIKLSLQRVIKELENHIANSTSNLLKEIDNLKEEVGKTA
ncbi:DNA-binding helix-turn-helix protein [Clostridiales bacterium oral taxon 876 str. F0540]|nr:DNA-binding helix-turn-helix protein [Clostridiales bacterium oral taxon 876 str. F0540]